MKQPTKENILKAHSEGCDDTKKAIENLWPDYFENKIEFNEDKIYAFKDGDGLISFLSLMPDGDYYWIRLESNNLSLVNNSFQGKVFDHISSKIEVFDNQEDFFTWALKQIS